MCTLNNIVSDERMISGHICATDMHDLCGLMQELYSGATDLQAEILKK